MATISSALREGALDEFALPEWENREPRRPLLAAPELFDWVDRQERLVDGSLVAGGRTPFEHLVQAFCDLRCAERPSGGDLRRLMPTERGVWKLHPPLLRVYGWFYAPLHFVAVTGALEVDTKADKTVNGRRRDDVLRFIQKHQLETTILKGDHRAVLQIPAR